MERIAIKDGDFLHSMMTSDRSWKHFELETKLQSMEWHHKAGPKKKNPTRMPSAHKLCKLPFGLLKDAYWLSIFNKRKPSVRLITFTTPWVFHALHEKCPQKKTIFLPYDSIQPHVAHLCMERIQKNS
jgi:hypothetical protein